EELRAARAAAPVSDEELLMMVTTSAATLLRQARAGRIAVGGPADLIVGPMATRAFSASDREAPDEPWRGPAEAPRREGSQAFGAALLEATRATLRLVVIDGRPMVGEPDFAPVFEARRVVARPIRVDGETKLAESGLARRIAGCPIAEPGVSVA